MKLNHFRQYYLPYLVDLVEYVDGLGVPVLLHCCGHLKSYLPDLAAETKISAIHPLQRTAGMDLRWVKENYGQRFCLIGNIDSSRTLPFGTPDDVVAEVREAIDIGRARRRLHPRIRPLAARRHLGGEYPGHVPRRPRVRRASLRPLTMRSPKRNRGFSRIRTQPSEAPTPRIDRFNPSPSQVAFRTGGTSILSGWTAQPARRLNTSRRMRRGGPLRILRLVTFRPRRCAVHPLRMLRCVCPQGETRLMMWCNLPCASRCS